MNANMSITQIRLRELIDDYKDKRNINRAEIAKAPELHCDPSTITKHYNGDRDINSKYIIGYAKFFGVSADYLLGLSDVKTKDKDLSEICNTLGFEEETVQMLIDCKKKNQSKDLEKIINALISRYDSVSWDLKKVLESTNEVRNKLEQHIEKLETLLTNLKKKDPIKKNNSIWNIKKRDKLCEELDVIYEDIIREYFDINRSITSLRNYDDLLRTALYSVVITNIENQVTRNTYFEARELAEAVDKEVSRILNKEIRAFINLENLCDYSFDAPLSTSDPWRKIDGDY